MQTGRYIHRGIASAIAAGLLIVGPSVADAKRTPHRSWQKAEVRQLVKSASLETLAREADPKQSFIHAEDLLPNRRVTIHECAQFRHSKSTICETTLHLYRRAGGSLDTSALIEVPAGGHPRFLTAQD